LYKFENNFYIIIVKIYSHLLNKNQKNNLMNIIDILNIVKNNNNSVFLYTPPIYDDAVSYILRYPKEVSTCNNYNEIENELNRADILAQQGLTGFALFNYELGYAFENKLNKYLKKNSKTPLFIILLFEENEIVKIPSKKINFKKAKELLLDPNHSIKDFKLNTTKKRYTQNIEEIKNQIEIGNTYQVNYTIEGKFNFEGSLESLFLSAVFNQSAQFSAFINLDNEFIISNSPELFFKKTNKIISAKPMKGTIKRGKNIIEDIKKSSQLLKSEKDLAENIMIVDLLRNDIGRVSELNSINVKSKFTLEKYETVYQLTSEVHGKLKGNNLYQILKNTFPCGSITGAPKISTMEIIKKLEQRERGIYTGSIGLFDKDEAMFNVAIRTIQISKKNNNGKIGIGSGIVWDSNADSEYIETNLKAKFLTTPDPYFELIETILFENGNYFLLNEHLERLEQASDYFLFVFNQKNILNKLDKLKNELLINSNKSFKVKILLDKWGSIELNSDQIPTKKKNDIKIKISDKRISCKNKFQYFKTTNRQLYDSELSLARLEEYDEVIFLNEKEEITEGSISNVFIKKSGKTFTPKISSGILKGVYREYLIKHTSNIYEKNITLNDLIEADEVYIINSVRKKMEVIEIWKGSQEFSTYS